MALLYFTSSRLLDFSIEQIKLISMKRSVDVIIVLLENDVNHTIFSTSETLTSGNYSWLDIKTKINNYNLFENYFKKCKSVSFVVFKKGYGCNTILHNFKLFFFVLRNNYSQLHFDDISPRLFFSLFVFGKKIILNLHDPVPHSGESKISDAIFRRFFFLKVDKFCVYSVYSSELFRNKFKKYSCKLNVLKLPIYYMYQKIDKCEINQLKFGYENYKKILFFGRISEYKNLPFLIKCFNEFTRENKKIILIVAGSGNIDAQLKVSIQKNRNIILFNRFIFINELTYLLNYSDIVVCPYTDATQSGVIMTAMAFGKPIIASNVGSFGEYIDDGYNGYLYENGNSDDFYSSIIKGFELTRNLELRFKNNRVLAKSYLDVYN